MNTLVARLGPVVLVLLAAGAVVQGGSQVDLIYFDENGGGGNPRALYNFDASTGNSTMRATVGGSRRYFSFDQRPSDQMVFAAEVVTGDALWTIDVDTGVLTFVSTHGLPTVADISFDPLTGTLYGLTRNTPYRLYTIDPGTGNSTPVGNTTNEVRTGLTFAPDGTLYAMELDGTLYTVDKNTAATTLVGGSGEPVSLIEDADFTPDGRLFAVDWNGEIIQIDPTTGHRTQAGLTGMGSGLTAVLGVPEPSAALLFIFAAGACLRRR